MDSFEFNKIAGAVLFAALVILGTSAISEIIFEPDHLAQSAYAVEGVEEAGHGSEAAEGTSEEASHTEETQVAAVDMTAGDAEAGAKVVKKCGACHTMTEGGKNKIGPNLFGILDNDIAAVAGYKYSASLDGVAGTWTAEMMDQWLTNPKSVADKTKMSFKLKKPKDRANLIAWFNQQEN